MMTNKKSVATEEEFTSVDNFLIFYEYEKPVETTAYHPAAPDFSPPPTLQQVDESSWVTATNKKGGKLQSPLFMYIMY